MTVSQEVRVFPSSLGSRVERTESLFHPFFRARKEMEKLVVLSRQMPNEEADGDWGNWFYHGRYEEGTLYTPFGNGMACVSLLKARGVKDAPLGDASFRWAFAHWSELRRVKDYEKEYKLFLAAFPGSVWMNNRGGELEPRLRRHFFYQQVGSSNEGNSILRLEQFGSAEDGWFKLNAGNVHSKIPTLRYGAVEARMFLDWSSVERGFKLAVDTKDFEGRTVFRNL